MLRGAARGALGRLVPARGRSPLVQIPDAPRPPGTRVLVAGWFSWTDMAATAGDLMARDVACAWLAEAGRDVDVANAPAFGPGVDWRTADPQAYADVVFVCGPARGLPPLTDFLLRFAGSRRVGLDLTMLDPLDSWNPFHVLLERDSDVRSHPDLAFAAPTTAVPVVGEILVEPYPPEFPDRDRQAQAREGVERLLGSRELARVPIDTRLPDNAGGLRTAAEVESLIARMDAVVTTRLHGLVLALKNGVPAVAIDPVAGGSKISRQAAAVGWPCVRTADALVDAELVEALDFCLGDAGRDQARECRRRAGEILDGVRGEFVDALRRPSSP